MLVVTTLCALLGATPRRVAVTGAGGQTGQHAFRKLLAKTGEFAPLGIVRSEESRAALLESGVPEEAVVVADVTDAAAIAAVMKGCDALIIGTSAKPAPIGTDEETGRPIFAFPNGQPEQVDWLGQKAQIDAAKACGPDTHVVICSSMGGTDPSNMLNALGRESLPDGSTKGGNILLWKRKAEKYLIDSGLPYTVVHPGGLLNEPGSKRMLFEYRSSGARTRQPHESNRLPQLSCSSCDGLPQPTAADESANQSAARVPCPRRGDRDRRR